MPKRKPTSPVPSRPPLRPRNMNASDASVPAPKAPETATWIDNTAYPGIVETIVRLAPFDVVRAFASTSKRMQRVADETLFGHVVVHPDDGWLAMSGSRTVMCSTQGPEGRCIRLRLFKEWQGEFRDEFETWGHAYNDPVQEEMGEPLPPGMTKAEYYAAYHDPWDDEEDPIMSRAIPPAAAALIAKHTRVLDVLTTVPSVPVAKIAKLANKLDTARYFVFKHDVGTREACPVLADTVVHFTFLRPTNPQGTRYTPKGMRLMRATPMGVVPRGTRRLVVNVSIPMGNKWLKTGGVYLSPGAACVEEVVLVLSTSKPHNTLPGEEEGGEKVKAATGKVGDEDEDEEDEDEYIEDNEDEVIDDDEDDEWEDEDDGDDGDGYMSPDDDDDEDAFEPEFDGAELPSGPRPCGILADVVTMLAGPVVDAGLVFTLVGGGTLDPSVFDLPPGFVPETAIDAAQDKRNTAALGAALRAEFTNAATDLQGDMRALGLPYPDDASIAQAVREGVRCVTKEEYRRTVHPRDWLLQMHANPDDEST